MKNKTLSRRKWLEQMSLPPIAATVDSTILGVTSAGAEQPRSVAFAERNLGALTRSCIVLNGVGSDFLEQITFQDVHVSYEGGGTTDEAVRDVPKLAGEYFEIGVPPAYGIYARNVRGLTLNNIRLEAIQPDLRPAVIFDNVADSSVNGLSAQGNQQAQSVLRFIDTREVLLTASRVLTPAAAFLELEGAASDGITIDGGDLSKASKPLIYSRGATEKSVKLRG